MNSKYIICYIQKQRNPTENASKTSFITRHSIPPTPLSKPTITSNQPARSITLSTARIARSLPRGYLRRRPREARRHVQDGIAREEVPRTEKKRHGLRRHDGVVLGGGEMGQAESVPEDDVGVVDGGVRAGGFDPCGEALGGFARGLGYVAACGVDLVVGV